MIVWHQSTCPAVVSEIAGLFNRYAVTTAVVTREEKMTEPIGLQVRTIDGHAVVAVSGEIDVSTAPALQASIDVLIQNGTRQFIVDLEAVDFIDSSCLKTLIRVIKQLGPSSLRVVASQPRVIRVFSVSGIDQLIPVFKSVEAAIAAASAQ
jgi:anti-sigma B factor antagonist